MTGAALRQRCQQPVETDRLLGQSIGAKARQRLRLVVSERRASISGKPAQQSAEIVAAALAEISQEGGKLLRGQGRAIGQPWIVAVLAGQHRQRNAARFRQRRQPVGAVAPPVETAQQPYNDHLRIRCDPLDPEIDRHRMLQVAQLHQPHARQRVAFLVALLVAFLGPGRRKPREIAVGKRQDRDIARRLAKIDRLDDVVEARRAGRKQMHQIIR